MAMLGMVFLVMFGGMHEYFLKEEEKSLQLKCHYIEIGIKEAGLSYLESLDVQEGRITWIDKNGVVLFDSDVYHENMENHSDREEVIKAQLSGEGESVRYSNTLAKETLYYAKELSDGTILRVSMLMTSIYSAIEFLSHSMIVIIFLMIVMSLFLALKTAQNITNPINTIDLDNPETANIYEELDPLLYKIIKQKYQIKQQIQNLKKQQQAFDTITEHMQEGLFVLDQQATILSYNQGALRLMGVLSLEEAENIFVLNRGESFRHCVEEALLGNHHEERLEIKGKICQLFANPVYEEEIVVGLVLILFDVTEKEQREVLRREFSANVSHELKTPLTSISGFAEIMKSGIVPEEDMKKFAGNIYEETQRLICLVQDIIKISNLDENAKKFQKEEVQLSDLVERTVERLISVGEKRDISFVMNIEKEVCMKGIQQVLQEIIYNLCDNAIRYNKEGGEIFVDLEEKPTQILLTVRDTGLGIEQSHLPRIFERFYRVSESRCKDIDGTGLGLAIVKHGVMLHDGTIDVKSQIDEGTEISISFMKQKEVF